MIAEAKPAKTPKAACMARGGLARREPSEPRLSSCRWRAPWISRCAGSISVLRPLKQSACTSGGSRRATRTPNLAPPIDGMPMRAADCRSADPDAANVAADITAAPVSDRMDVPLAASCERPAALVSEGMTNWPPPHPTRPTHAPPPTPDAPAASIRRIGSF
eukprot:scaffold3207_cov112-Isochrysis_galbana.AAC.3